jgi:sulfate transport system permease protein
MKRTWAFRTTLLWTLLYLVAIVLLPLTAFGRSLLQIGPKTLWALALQPRALSALAVSFSCAMVAAALACVLGLMIVWVLDRYRFVGRSVLDVCVDLPLALPTAVGGLALAYLFSPAGALGRALLAAGIPVAYTRLGIVVALVFTALPAVVRTLQPTLRSLDPDVEEAAACLGATKLQIFQRVLLPQLYAALVSGFLLAFARALAEYGSVAFLSGNLPLRTETVPVLVLARVEQGDMPGATAVAAAHLLLAALCLYALGSFQDRLARKGGR